MMRKKGREVGCWWGGDQKKGEIKDEWGTHSTARIRRANVTGEDFSSGGPDSGRKETFAGARYGFKKGKMQGSK